MIAKENIELEDRISAEELTRLIEAEKTEKGYEFILWNKRYLSTADLDSVKAYSSVVSEIMEHISELVESDKVSAAVIEKLDKEISDDEDQDDETTHIVHRVYGARKSGIIDDKFEEYINRLSEINGVPPGTTWHLLLDRPTFSSAILSVMDVYAHNYKEDPNYYYDSGAYFLLRMALSRDFHTTEIEGPNAAELEDEGEKNAETNSNHS